MKKSTIYIGADHAGFELKEQLEEFLTKAGYPVEDVGATQLEQTDDYPQYAKAVAEAVVKNPESLGILSCGNAQGVCIAANKIDGIRAGIGFSLEAASTMRVDDNANIICIPGRIEIQDDPIEIAKTFLETAFSGAKRHERRLQQVTQIEQDQ